MNRLYAFLYDDFLSAPSYQKIIANIETRCSVLGIQGRVSRLAIFRSAKEIVESLVLDGAKTIVIVGNDRTLQKVMWFLPDLPVTIGYIPVSDPYGIAHLLGIPPGEGACDVLAARRVESIDIGKIDDRYFLTEILLRDTTARVDIHGAYAINATHAGTISVQNLGSITSERISMANAKDGLLDCSVRPLQQGSSSGRWAFFRGSEHGPQTNIQFQSATITSREPVDAVVDGHPMNGFRFEVKILKEKLRIITGRKKILDPMSLEALSNFPKPGIVSATQAHLHKIASWWRKQRMYL